jgi:hypothetical protein
MAARAIAAGTEGRSSVVADFERRHFQGHLRLLRSYSQSM